MELSCGVEYWSGVESNFGVITPADSVYLTFSNIWTDLFDLTSGHWALI